MSADGRARVVAIPGSLRRASHNRAVLRAARDLAPDGMEVSLHGIEEIPPYNGDLEGRGDPPAVAALAAAVRSADGVLISTPEFQHGVPGVLKNALDWLSRPPGGSPLLGKPVAIMGASPGVTGTARAQSQLRQSLVYNRCAVLPPPEVLIGRVREKVDDAGDLVDEETRGFIADALARFRHWIARGGGE